MDSALRIRPGFSISHAKQMVSHSQRNLQRSYLLVPRVVQNCLSDLQCRSLRDSADHRIKRIIQQSLSLVSNNGSQPTSKKYMQACSVMEVKQIFASYNNPKGNADTERVIRTIKEDFVWTREFASPVEFAEQFKQVGMRIITTIILIQP